MRDHTKLKVFEEADRLVFLIYGLLPHFPRDERYGLTSQLRRSATSIACNIVEGCGRSSTAEYCRFIEIAYSSGRELGYQLTLVRRLGFLEEPKLSELVQIEKLTDVVCRMLNRLLQNLSGSD